MLNAKAYGLRVVEAVKQPLQRAGFPMMERVNADLIVAEPFYHTMCLLTYLLSYKDEKGRAEINVFFGNYLYLSDFSIQQILEFSQRENPLDDGSTITITEANGVALMEQFVENLKHICQ